MHQQLDKKKIMSILGMRGGSLLNITLDNVPYNCTKNIPIQEQMANILSGQQGGAKKKSAKKTNKKSKKSMYREYLDKKYSKNQLLKKCKELGIKVTTRKNGMIKPVKKETLVNKIVKIKFN
tara:strand:+ start:5423 stop:5788 length:366 start_codon:yes stop_codon:yes gene_type:complete